MAKKRAYMGRETGRYYLLKDRKSRKYEGQTLPWRVAQRDTAVLTCWVLVGVYL